MMDCEIKLNDCEFSALQEGEDSSCQGRGWKNPLLSQEDVIGLTVIAAFLASAGGFTALGYDTPLFFLIVPTLFAAWIGLLAKKICEQMSVGEPNIAEFLHRIYTLMIAPLLIKL